MSGLVTTVENRVKIIPITEQKEFFGMEKEWNSLLRNSRSNTIFLTWEWLTAWWKSYSEGKDLFILSVEKDGQIIGIAPFYRKKIPKLGFLQFRALALIGDGSNDSDYLDWISRNGEEELVVRAITDFLIKKRADWDLILINEIPEKSPHLTLLLKHFYQGRCYCEEVEVPCAYVELPSDWEKYLKSLRPRMRTKIRSLIKRLEQGSEVHFDLCRKANDIENWLESFFDIHNKRWQNKNRSGVFVSPSKCQFYQEMSHLFLSRGWLRFYSLKVDGRYVAYQFCFEYNNTIFLLQEGYDPQMDELGIGNILRAYVFRDCIERNVKVYDFLEGVTPHKLSWGAAVKKSYRLSIGLPKIKNRLLWNITKGINLGKKTLKTLLGRHSLI